MYNEEQKACFIRSYTQSEKTAKIAVGVFNICESYEKAYNSDLCMMDTDKLQKIVDAVAGVRAASKWSRLSILRAYTKWCLAEGVPNATGNMNKINFVGLGKIRNTMVANPMHMQTYHNAVFEEETLNTIDILYRCYLWLGYGGIRESDLFKVKVSDVQFENMEVHYGLKTVYLYREAVPAFMRAVNSDKFTYLHPNYSTEIGRIPGDELLRGIKGNMNIMTMRARLSRYAKEAVSAGRTEQHISFTRAALSGIFYRAYELERYGDIPDFESAVDEFMFGKEYAIGWDAARKKLLREYLEDYQRWKLAFSV